MDPALTGSPPVPPKQYKRFYLSVAAKFVLSVLFVVLSTSVAVWLSFPWIQDLSRLTGAPAALVIVTLVAYLPGSLVALMTMSLLLDRQPPLTVSDPQSPLTILVAARNEESAIATTIRNIGQSDYAGEITVILADNGSEDDTTDVASRAAADFGVSMHIVPECRNGTTTWASPA